MGESPEPFDLLKVSDIEDTEPHCAWLVSRLWSDGVGIIGGEPKSCKSWLGLDIALSVASGTPCLGHFEVPTPGKVLLYLAEDSLTAMKQRLTSVAESRGLDLSEQNLFTLTVPRLRVDDERDQDRLQRTLHKLQPRLVLLDPLVRISRADENNANEIADVLGYLRGIQREFECSVILVHHSRKPRGDSRKGGGLELRGSSDLYAWVDTGVFLDKNQKRIRVSVEHRSARPPEDFEMALADDEKGLRLELTDPPEEKTEAQETPLRSRILSALEASPVPLDAKALRMQVGGSNERIRQILGVLSADGAIRKVKGGYVSPEREVVPEEFFV